MVVETDFIFRRRMSHSTRRSRIVDVVVATENSDMIILHTVFKVGGDWCAGMGGGGEERR